MSEPVTDSSESPSCSRVNSSTPTPPIITVTGTEATEGVHLRVRNELSNTPGTSQNPTPCATPGTTALLPLSSSPSQPLSLSDLKNSHSMDDLKPSNSLHELSNNEIKQPKSKSKLAWFTEANKNAKFALLLLFAINLFNYIDRYVPSGAKSLIQKDLNLTDTQTSLPLTAFMIVFMTLSPMFAYLSDRGYPRTWLIALGVASWSVATSTAGLANNYAIFIISRAFIGVGEAAYATIAPALLSDYWSSQHRNSMLSFFYLAIPVGAAVGFGIGGYVGQAAGWRVAFLVCGTPGVALALVALKVVDPPRGCQESIPEIILAMDQKSVTLKEALLELPRNTYYCFVVGGATLVVFASGGMADWFPEWLHRQHNVSVGFAGLVVGGVTVLGGLGGIVLGAYASDYFRSRVRNAYLLTCSIALLMSSMMAVIVLLMPSGTNVYILALLLLVCQVFLWIYIGPVNSLIANSVPARLRVRAFGGSILITHLFGDAISPSIIGAISDSTGSLTKALILIPITFFLAAVVWAIGWFRLKSLAFEQEALDAALAHKPNTKQSTPIPLECSTPIEPTLIEQTSPRDEPRASLMLGIPDSLQLDKLVEHHLKPRVSIVGSIPVIVLEDTVEPTATTTTTTPTIITDGPDHGLHQPTNSPKTVRNRHHSKETVVVPE